MYISRPCVFISKSLSVQKLLCGINIVASDDGIYIRGMAMVLYTEIYVYDFEHISYI